jgi:hypothetical protein
MGGAAIPGRSLERRRFVLTLLGTFAGLALLLAVVGIYGVISAGRKSLASWKRWLKFVPGTLRDATVLSTLLDRIELSPCLPAAQSILPRKPPTHTVGLS